MRTRSSVGWERSATVLACVAMFAFATVPPRARGQAAIETCEDWVGEAAVRCGTAFPQGAPWLTYVFRGIPAGRYALQRDSATFAGTPAIVVVGGTVAHFALTNAGRRVLPAGQYTVTLTDQAAGRTVAEGTYNLTPQTPREALATWHGQAGDFATMGAALAAWRLADAPTALSEARRVVAAGRWTIGLAFAYSLIYEISMAGRDYPGAIEAVESLMRARKAAYDVRQETVPAQPVEYEWLVRAQIAACQLDPARTTLAEGLRAFPNYRGFATLTAQIERARSTCP